MDSRNIESAFIWPKKKYEIFYLGIFRATFNGVWQVRDYVTIIAMADKKYHSVLGEIRDCSLWHEQEVRRMGGD